MRQIQFRGLRTDGKGWAYGVPVTDGKRTYIVSGVVDSNEDFITIEQWQPVRPETVGQFTGLHDRNGVRVFDGDTVTINGNEYFIRFNTGVFVAESVIANHLSLLPWQFNGTNVTVTGNIHEPATVRK